MLHTKNKERVKIKNDEREGKKKKEKNNKKLDSGIFCFTFYKLARRNS